MLSIMSCSAFCTRQSNQLDVVVVFIFTSTTISQIVKFITECVMLNIFYEIKTSCRNVYLTILDTQIRVMGSQMG